MALKNNRIQNKATHNFHLVVAVMQQVSSRSENKFTLE